MNQIFSILHPTDLSEASQLAFVHALKIVLTCGSRLDILRIKSRNLPIGSEKYPPVRDTLERWGYLPKNSSRAAVYSKLDFKVKKTNSKNSSPHYSIKRYLDRYSTDLIVLPIQTQLIYSNYINYNIFGSLGPSNNYQILFIPSGARGFISYYDGSVTLKNILIPIIHSSDPIPAIEEAAALIDALGYGKGKITLLYFGNSAWLRTVNLSEFSNCQWDHIYLYEDAADQCVNLSHKIPADLIVWTTESSKQHSNANMGSDLELVLRNVSCPILTIGSQ